MQPGPGQTSSKRPYLANELDGVEHPAANLLREWRDNGVPVLTSSEPWFDDLKDSHVERGCHCSADEHSVFLCKEMSEFIDNRFWAVLPYSTVRHLPQLQLSPAMVKEEREQKPHLLCNHSWNPVDENTLPHSPPNPCNSGKPCIGYCNKFDMPTPTTGRCICASSALRTGSTPCS
jgi:hypothetical protein